MRQTEFWERMRQHFGAAYADSVATDQVLAGLGGRTISEALAAGDDVHHIWRVVCATFDVPAPAR